MRILHVTYKDSLEGAAIASKRMYDAQMESESDVSILVIDRLNESGLFKLFFWIFIRFVNLADKIFRAEVKNFTSLELFTYDWTSKVRSGYYDVIHIHWLHRGLVDDDVIRKLSSKTGKLFISLHDFRYISGACHIPYECKGYLDECKICPQNRLRDRVRSNKIRRNNLYNEKKIHFICPSQWVLDEVASMGIIEPARLHLIPNTIDVDVFRSGEQSTVKSPTKVGFLVSSDSRKGMNCVVRVAEVLSNSGDWQFYGFGGDIDFNRPNIVSVGHIIDPLKLNQFYNEMDLLLLPASYEPYGQIVAEAIASGTPVVCFKGSGPDSIVQHKVTGYLADLFSIDDLITGMEYVKNLRQLDNDRLRERVSSHIVAQACLDAYRS